MKTKIRPRRIRRKSSGYDTETPKPAFTLSRKENAAHNPDIISANINKRIENQIHSNKGKGEKLSGSAKSLMEIKFGKNFDNIRIHKDEQAANLSKQLNAVAFTAGSDIYFNKNQYNPESYVGQKLIAHELTHTIQQNNNQSQNSVIQKKDNKKSGTTTQNKTKKISSTSRRLFPKYRHLKNWFKPFQIRVIKRVYEQQKPKTYLTGSIPLFFLLSSKIKSSINKRRVYYSKKIDGALFNWFKKNYAGRNRKNALLEISYGKIKINIKNQLSTNIKDHDLNSDGFIDWSELKKAFTPLPKNVLSILKMIPLIKKAIKTLKLPKGLDLDFAINYLRKKDLFDVWDSKLKLAILAVSQDNNTVAQSLISLLKQKNIVWVDKFTAAPKDTQSSAITTGKKIELRRTAFAGGFVSYDIQKLAGILVHEEYHTRQGSVRAGIYRCYGRGYYDPLEFPAWKSEVLYLETRWNRLVKKLRTAKGIKKEAIKKVIFFLQDRINLMKTTIQEDRTSYVLWLIPCKFKILDTQETKGRKAFNKLFSFTKNFIRR